MLRLTWFFAPSELDIETVSRADIKGTYVFDMKNGYAGIQDLQKALTFSRKQLLQEATRRGYNALLVERLAYIPAGSQLLDLTSLR